MAKMLRINPQICPQDHVCPLVRMCPVEAIMQQGMGLPVIDARLCIRCGACEAHCPRKAVEYVD